MTVAALEPSPIEPLLAALREAGLPVGVTETLRIRTLVESMAVTEGPLAPRLKDLIACVVARGKEERETFERVFEAWGEASVVRGSVERAGPAVSPVGPTGKRRRWWSWRVLAAFGGGVVLVGLIVAAIQYWPPPEPVVAAEVDAGAAETDAGTAEVDPGEPMRPSQYRARTLVFTVEAPPGPSWAAVMGLSLGAAGLLALLMRFLKPERYWPAHRLRPSRRGPEARPLLAPLRGATAGLLTATERSDLAFAVDRFMRDEPSPELDVPRSIDATVAAGGRAVPVFRPHVEHRTVWLWSDAGAESPLAARFAGEAHAALASAGLPCERAAYHLIPDALELAEGDTLAPRDLDEAAHGSAVLLVTDGAALARRLAQRAAFAYAAPLFRLLARWPRVAIVGVTAKAITDLSPLVHRFGLAVIGPDEVEGFLQGLDTRPDASRQTPMLAGDALAWGAACALSERPVDVPTALALRDSMGLRTTPWALDLLLGDSEEPSGTLRVSKDRRAAWLRWLGDQTTGSTEEMPVPTGSALFKALAFWRGRLMDEGKRRSADDARDPWTDTPAARRIEEELALLALWDAPRGAADTLRGIHGPADTTEKGELLRAYAVLARRGESAEVPTGVILLPWCMGELEGAAPAILCAYGLSVVGAADAAWSVGLPSRALLAVAVAVGVFGGGVLAGGARQASLASASTTCSVPVDGTCDVVSGEDGVRVRATIVGAQGESGPVPDGVLVRVSLGSEVVLEDPATLIKSSRECPYREETLNGIALVRVCGGAFRMGDDKLGTDDEKPAHDVQVSTFWIGKYEVSNEQYWQQIPAHAKDKKATWPVTGVSWTDAGSFCTSRGLRLPTEAEWEYAARGPESRRYPWGEEEASRKLAVMNAEEPSPVDALATVGSPFGTANQSGNVWEWVEDCSSSTVYKDRAGKSVVDPRLDTPPSCFRVLRGGSFRSLNPRGLRSASRFSYSPEYLDDGFGFRCVRGGSLQP